MAAPVLEPGPRGGRRLERRPRNNYEAWSWVFMRLSGLVLLFLALTHFAITHIINDVVDTDAAFVGERWSNPLWRIFDWALLALALSHGLNGVRWIIEDYVHTPVRRCLTKVTLYSMSLGLFAYGTYTIVSFSAP